MKENGWMYVCCTIVAHHDNFYGDGYWQLGFESVIELFHNEHHYQNHQGDHHVTHVAGGYRTEDDLQGLKKICFRNSDTAETALK